MQFYGKGGRGGAAARGAAEDTRVCVFSEPDPPFCQSKTQMAQNKGRKWVARVPVRMDAH